MSLSIAATFAKASLALRSCGGWFCSGRNLNLPVMEVYKKPLRFPVSVTNYEQLTDYYQKYKKASFDLSDFNFIITKYNHQGRINSIEF